MNERDWIDVLAALLTPTVAVIATYIAWQQWNTAEAKRRQDLFDKRHAYFKLIWHYYEDHIKKPDHVPPTNIEDLLDYAHEAEFLFGDDVVKHIFEIPEKQKTGCVDYDWYSRPFKKYMKLS